MRVSGAAPPLLTQQPFGTRGVSLYVRDALPLIYRVQQTVEAAPLMASGPHLYAASTVARTTRVAFQAGAAGAAISLDHDLSAYASDTVYVDLAHCADHVENRHRHPRKLILDASGNAEPDIRGRAGSLGYEARSGGMCRFHFRYVAAVQGVQPVTFELRRTSGPTSPAAVSRVAAGTGLYFIDSAALDDSATYTFTVVAINGVTEKTLLTYSNVQPDASGPPAPANLSVSIV